MSTKLGHKIYAYKVSDEFDYGTNRTRLSAVICPWIGKIAESDFVYTLASTNYNQSAPKLVKMYVIIRSWMSAIMNCPSYLPLNLQKLLNLTILHPNIYKCRPISSKHGHNIYDTEILDEFDYGSNPTVTSGFICPWIRKHCLIWLCSHLSIYRIINQHLTWSKCMWPWDLERIQLLI